jgi:hypothetical protein
MRWTQAAWTPAALAVVAALYGVTPAQAAPLSPTTGIHAVYTPGAETGTLLQTVQYRGRYGDRGRYRDRRFDRRDAFRDRRYWDRRYGRGYYDRHYGGYRRDDGAAVAAGFLGFVLGAAIAGSANDRSYAQSHMGDAQWAASCAQRYRSFDPQSGTYLGYDGYRHYCL